MRVHAVIPAAGSGTRMGPGQKKQFRLIAGQPVLAYAVRALCESGLIDSLTLAVPEDEIAQVAEAILPLAGDLSAQVVVGGADRQASVWNGIQGVEDAAEGDFILVHDGVRPFLTKALLAEVIGAAKEHGAASVGVPAKDTIKIVDEARVVQRTPPREHCWQTQTPQVFRYEIIHAAHERALAETPDARGTDDAGLVERFGGKVVMTMGIYENIKITTPEDLAVAEVFAAHLVGQGEKK